MLFPRVTRRWVPLIIVATGVLAGCGTGTTPAGSPMMNGVAGAASTAGMMDHEPGYEYSQLSCGAPTSPPGSTVNVALGDMGMNRMTTGIAPVGAHMMLRATPTTVPAGQVNLLVSNMGWRPHELVVLPLPVGAATGERVPGADGKIDESGSVGEVSASCAEGTGDGLAPGTVGWTSLTLQAGRFELVCNLPNHYADGMYQMLVVT